jgi:hypothetical protein
MFTNRLRGEGRSLGLRVIGVDTVATEDDPTAHVARALGL